MNANLSETEITSAFLDEAAIAYPGYGKSLHLPDVAIRAAFDPVRSVQRRAVHGGVAPPRVAEQITRSRAQLETDRQAVTAKRHRLKHATDSLEQAIDRLTQGTAA